MMAIDQQLRQILIESILNSKVIFQRLIDQHHTRQNRQTWMGQPGHTSEAQLSNLIVKNKLHT